MKDRVAISGGGTGGHTYPAIAVAEMLRDLGDEPFFLGREGGMEERACKERGIRFLGLPLIPTPRGARIFPYLARILLGIVQSLLALRVFDADIVLGMGGYVCVPAVISAKMLGIPVALHEQNVVPGRANKFLARISDLFMISFESSRCYLGPGIRAVLTGNPIRKGIVGVGREEAREKLGIGHDIGMVLILGGSYGSRRISEAAIEAIRAMRGKGLYFVLISGDAFYEDTLRMAGGLGSDVRVIPFSHDMGLLYGASDLVVSSAGATTIAEICACGLPSILIPKSHVVEGHQVMNALALLSEGAASVIREEELRGDLLASEISRIMEDEGLRRRMGERARSLGRPNATEDLVKEMKRLILGAKG